jgi:hypothetical protein
MSKVKLGQLVATRGAIEAFNDEEGEDFLARCIARHQSGDWGDVCDEDKAANDTALANGERLLSSYSTPGGVKLWIITEWDRSLTTCLLPSEY